MCVSMSERRKREREDGPIDKEGLVRRYRTSNTSSGGVVKKREGGITLTLSLYRERESSDVVSLFSFPRYFLLLCMMYVVARLSSLPPTLFCHKRREGGWVVGHQCQERSALTQAKHRRAPSVCIYSRK